MSAQAGPARRCLLAALLALLALAAGCGGEGGRDAAGRTRATLILDFVPGPVHAGIYRALERGYYEEQGIDLQVAEPGSTSDALRLVDAGKAQFGIADGIDLATQILRGRDVQAVLALTQRPLGGLISLAESGYSSPAALEGGTVGVTGVPSDAAVLETILEHAGADPGAVRRVTVGFNGVRSLEAGKIDAFVGFIPADGVQAELDGYPIRAFALDEYGGPRYPGLVVFATRGLIAERPQLVEGFVRATVRGYEDVLADPGLGLEALLERNPAIPREFARASLDAYQPLFVADAERYGEIDEAEVARLGRFLVERGLARERIAPDRYGTNRFVDAAHGGG